MWVALSVGGASGCRMYFTDTTSSKASSLPSNTFFHLQKKKRTSRLGNYVPGQIRNGDKTEREGKIIILSASRRASERKYLS